MKEKKNGNEPLTDAVLQTILDQIKRSERNIENYVHEELTNTNNKVDALQTGVSNLKKDMTQVKNDVREIKTDLKQVKEDVSTITSDYGYERDKKGKLKLA